MKRVLILVRHAQSEGNIVQERGDAKASPRDAPLSALGEAQAADSALQFAKNVSAFQHTAADSDGGGSATESSWLLASSPLTRALQTAELIWPTGHLPAPPSYTRRAVASELREFLIDADVGIECRVL